MIATSDRIGKWIEEPLLMPVSSTMEISDCKTSPLSYLMQICSNIGAEKPTSKGSTSSSSASDKSSANEEIRVTKESSKDAVSACTPDTSIHSTPTLGSSVSKREENSNSFHQREKDNTSSNSKRNTPSEPRSSPLGRSSVECRRTPASSQRENSSERKTPSEGSNNAKSSAANGTSSSSLAGSDSHVPTTSTSASSSSDRESNYSSSLGLDYARTDAGLLASKETASTLGQVGLGSYKAGLNGLNPLALANCSGCSPVAGHIPLDAASATYPLAAANALKSGGYGFGSALSPYMNYARMKTATGASTFVPVCRDPYCTNCQLASQLPYAQDRLAAHLSASSGLYPTGLPGYLPTSVPSFVGSAASTYVSSVLPRPHICSWMVGDTWCGKMFSSPDELLQHAKTHASLAGIATSSPLYSGVSLPSALSMDAAACGLYTTPPSLTTPAGLRRTYPTSLSPVSSLSAASRYHPYKPPGLSPLSSAPPLPPLAHPRLGFYNPYSGVYGKG